MQWMQKKARVVQHECKTGRCVHETLSFSTDVFQQAQSAEVCVFDSDRARSAYRFASLLAHEE